MFVIRVLGPIQIVTTDGQSIDLSSVSQRRLLAVLAVHAPKRVRGEWLAEVLQLSPSGMRTGIARLRKALRHADHGGGLVSTGGGYQLTAPVDAQRFCRAVAESPDNPDDRLAMLATALGWWVGGAFEEFAGEDWAAGESARLTELYTTATEDYVEELLAAHRWSDAIATLAEYVPRHPLRDHARGLMLRALAGSGRRAEALQAYQDYRTLLAAEIGTEPSPQFHRIGQRVAGGWNGSDAGAPTQQPLRPAGALPPPLASVRSGPFVGRSKIVAELRNAWQAGRWRALLVGGEAGIGKTRLLSEVAHELVRTDQLVTAGRCNEDVVVSYRPWAELLEPLVRSLSAAQEAALGPDHRRELHRVGRDPVRDREVGSGTGTDADTRLALLMDAVVALLQVVGPVVLVLDDIQWIDRPSLQLLRRVLMSELPAVTVLGAYRETDVGPHHPLVAVLADLRPLAAVRRLTVDGLTDSAVVQLVESQTGQALDAPAIALAHTIHARTAGNPLFALELINHLSDPRDRSIGPELPDGLVELIDRRIRRLGDDAVAVLRVAAVAGHRFDVDVVEETVALQPGTSAVDVLVQLDRARDAGVIVDDGEGMEFRHAVIRSALLGLTSATRRRRLHRDIAAVGERLWSAALGRHLEELAHHHDKAGTADAPRWYQRAAAAAVGAHDASAADLAGRGLALLTRTDAPDPVLRCDLLIAEAVGLRLASRETLGAAGRAADAAIALGDKERIASALLSLSVRSSERDTSDHITFLTAGLAHLTDLTQVSRWAVATGLSLRKAMVPATDTAVHRREMLDVVSHLTPSDPRACQIAMRCARSLTSTSLPRDAVPIAERFAPGCGGVDSDGLPIELGLSTMWLHLGDRDRADRYLDAAANQPLRRHWGFDCQVRQRLTMRHLLEARWSEAATEIAETRSRAMDDPTVLLACEAQLSWLRRETGAVDANVRITSELIATHPDLLLPQAVLASDAAEAGDTALAHEQLDRFAAGSYAGAGRHWMAVMALGNLAWAAITSDARSHAAELRGSLASYGGQMAVIGTGTHVLCAIDRLLAGLADLDGEYATADRLFASALGQDRRMRSPALAARTRHWWGRALLRRGDVSGARQELRRSRAIAERLGMAGLVAQLDALG